jgi:hypothetical protein
MSIAVNTYKIIFGKPAGSKWEVTNKADFEKGRYGVFGLDSLGVG